MRPTVSLLLAIFALFGVATLALQPTASISPDEAASHEGHGAVVVEGQARNVRTEGGRSSFRLHGEGSQLEVRVAGELALEEGVGLRATGFLARRSGELTLMVAASRDVETKEPPEEQPIPLSAVAEAPHAWLGRAIALEGTLTGSELGDGEGHRIRVIGERLSRGTVRLHGLVDYAPSCLCYTFHPVPWN